MANGMTGERCQADAGGDKTLFASRMGNLRCPDEIAQVLS